jgi:hypothetical protein
MIPRAAWYLVTKAERAQLLLDAFNGHVAAFMKEPYTVIRHYDAKNRRHIKRFELKSFEPILGLVLGDFLYCLRSGLDQMAWQMATPIARRDFSRDICFPIYEDLGTPDRKRNYLDILQLFPADVAKEIDALQPHNGLGPAQDHPLWQLNKLCNLDKHARIPIHSRGLNVFYPAVLGVSVDHFDQEDAIEVSVPEEYESSLDLKPTLPDEIEIGEWNSDWRLPHRRLSDIHGFITCTVIPRFMPFNLADVPTQPIRVSKPRPVY